MYNTKFTFYIGIRLQPENNVIFADSTINDLTAKTISEQVSFTDDQAEKNTLGSLYTTVKVGLYTCFHSFSFSS